LQGYVVKVSEVAATQKILHSSCAGEIEVILFNNSNGIFMFDIMVGKK
jgi:hypothetical protein